MSGSSYWLASYPKSGNTWFRAFLTALRGKEEAQIDINNMQTDGIASGRRWIDEVLGFDSADLTPDEIMHLRPLVYRWSGAEPEPRYVKVHDAYVRLANGDALFPAEATTAALYIVRNPLDVAPSFARHMGMNLDDTIAAMGNPDFGLVMGTHGIGNQVHQPMGTWSDHVLSWIEAEGIRLEVIRFEDMKNAPLSTFTRAATLLGLPSNPERVSRAIDTAAIENLRAQEAEKGFRERSRKAGAFFGEGKTGGWRDKLNPEQVAKIVTDHGEVMRRLGYLDDAGNPV